MTHSTQLYRIGIDIGGTFTDLILVNTETGQFTIGKTLTTPDDPSIAVEKVLLEALQESGVDSAEIQGIIHGTTLVTNAMIERKGALTALLTTEGFRDSIEIGRETRYDLYDLMIEQPQPLAPRYLRFDVPQRTLSDGQSYKALDEAYVTQLARELADNGIEAVAVCYLHSFTNSADENRTREIFAKVAPQIRVSISSEVVPEIREFERASTTLANVYTQELVETYLTRLEERLSANGFKGNFYLMLSSGGIATVNTAIKFPVRLLESGPAAGAIAANAYGKLTGNLNLISFDMGGTTAKICVIDEGEPLIAHEFEVDRIYRFAKGSGLPIKIPVIDMIEIGTGGGSIARLDSMSLLKTGPDSAGSSPGPVCYDNGGTEPTITDANLILGFLDADFFLGGKMTLNFEKALNAIEEKIAKPLGISIEEAAWGVHQVANENMANAARVHALERGKDPRKFPLFAFGGAGPIHAMRIAASLGSPYVLVPLGAGVMSTIGFLSAPLSFDFVRSWPVELGTIDWEHATKILESMEADGESILLNSDVDQADITHRREVDMRYVGQGHEIAVQLPAGELSHKDSSKLRLQFERAYLELYERLGPPVNIEIINWRVVSSGPKPRVDLQFNGEQITSKNFSETWKSERPVYFPEIGGYVHTAIYDRYRMKPGMRFIGPAIVEERESTVIINPGAKCHIDNHYNLVILMPENR